MSSKLYLDAKKKIMYLDKEVDFSCEKLTSQTKQRKFKLRNLQSKQTRRKGNLGNLYYCHFVSSCNLKLYWTSSEHKTEKQNASFSLHLY